MSVAVPVRHAPFCVGPADGELPEDHICWTYGSAGVAGGYDPVTGSLQIQTEAEDLTPAQARELAGQLLRVADELERVAQV